MLRKFLLLAIFGFLLGIPSLVLSQPTFGWAKAMGGSGIEHIVSLVTDSSGYIYVTGTFEGTADFNPGPAVSNLTSAGGTDVFLVKLDPSGNFEWAKSVGGAGLDNVRAGAHFYNDASFLLTGTFEGTVDFDPGAGTTNLTAGGGSDIYVARYSGQGDLVWANHINSSSSSQETFGIRTYDGVYTTGYFAGTADFDPGPGTANLTAQTGIDAFVCKWDFDGNYQWAKVFNGSPGGGSGIDLGFHHSVGVFTIGYFSGTTDFDPGAGMQSLTSAGSYDAFITCLDFNGNFQWAKAFGPDVYGISIYCDSSAILAGGRFEGTPDFDPGLGQYALTSAGGFDAFVMKLDLSGELAWAGAIGGPGADIAYKVYPDWYSYGVFVAGQFSGTADFDPDFSTFNMTAAGGTDAFIAPYDGNGAFRGFATKLGGPGNDACTDLRQTHPNDFLAIGYFENTVDFNPTSGTYNLTSAGDRDVFVTRLNGFELGSEAGADPVILDATIYPNPTAGRLSVDYTLARNAQVTVRVYNAFGQVVATPWAGKQAAGVQHLEMDAAEFAAGIYQVECSVGEERTTAKFVVAQ